MPIYLENHVNHALMKNSWPGQTQFLTIFAGDICKKHNTSLTIFLKFFSLFHFYNTKLIPRTYQRIELYCLKNHFQFLL